MLRVCGAEGERDALSRSQCWCRGLFCGKGGAKKSAEFRRDTGKRQVARSRAEFEEMVCQLDLFEATKVHEKWMKLVPPAQVVTHERFRTRQNR